MVRFSRVFVLISSLLLVAVFFFPLWRIGLKAPQYPEGLSLSIWINKITGDVRNINILNHYIGMGKVEPEKFKELLYFPYFFGGLAVCGFFAAAINHRRFTQLWALALISFACWGLYDFYAWEYDYAHNLNPEAAIQMDENYQPPLIGTKQILNITASSWPDKGGFAFAGAATLAIFIFITLLGKADVKIK